MPIGDTLRELLAPARGLDADERAAVAAARRAQNLDRATIVVPVVAAVEVAALILLRPRGDGVERVWRERLFALYLGLLAALLLVGALAFLARRPAVRAHLGEILSALLVAGAVGIVHHSHLVGFGISPYLIAIAISVVTFRIPVGFAAVLSAAGLAAILASILGADMPGLQQQRQALNALVIALFGFVMARSLYRALGREVVARRALERLNASLEDQVAAQVAEITARAREVELLNQSLRERVHNRSQELALALGRLAASAGQPSLPAGTVMGDRFELERLIGVGGMGVVYAARDRRLGASVAVKLIRSADSVEQLQRFLDEARAAAAIDHPAIVRVLHVDVSGEGALFQVLELLDGRSLDHVLAEHGLLRPTVAIRIGEVVAAGLAAAHARGIVHRDIKPANLMLIAAAPGLKILDFGLAKLRRQPGLVETAGDTVLGTPGFLAPEQIATPEEITGAADVYALGATLYVCLAGVPAFSASHALEVLHHQVHEAPPDLAARAPDLPAGLAPLVMRCLARDPAERPAADELGARLGALAAELDAPPLTEHTALGEAGQTQRLRRVPA